MVSTLRKNKRQITKSYWRNCTIGTKRNKVVLLSSLRHKTGRKFEENYKPEILVFTIELNMVSTRSTICVGINKWTMKFFLNMLDQASVNTSILYNFMPHNEFFGRCQFLKKGCVITYHLRYQQDHLQVFGFVISLTLRKTKTPHLAIQKMSNQKGCFLHPTERDHKTNYYCAKWGKLTCDEH